MKILHLIPGLNLLTNSFGRAEAIDDHSTGSPYLSVLEEDRLETLARISCAGSSADDIRVIKADPPRITDPLDTQLLFMAEQARMTP